MCGSCASPYGYCGCTGGDVFGMCPCSKGLECPICGHYPNKALASSKIDLAALLKPALLKKQRAAYKKLEKKHQASHKHKTAKKTVTKAKKKTTKKKTRK